MAPPSPFKALHDSSQHLDEAIPHYLERAQALETAIEANAFGRNTLGKLFCQGSRRVSILPLEKQQPQKGERGAESGSQPIHGVRASPVSARRRSCSHLCDECRFFPTSKRPSFKCWITGIMLVVTHVCTNWQRLAINTLTLWTHVDIIDNGPHARRQGEWGRMWLERAGSAPLSPFNIGS
ncbi:hypothetical protein FRC06_003229 [Ceratobasidium sp. 370]|nr:hypothetical protein FRC06_003229 [Ceratobasidium sp. 370]